MNAKERSGLSPRGINTRECYQITWNQGDFLYIGLPQTVAHETFIRLGIEYEAKFIHESSPKAFASDGKISKALSGTANALFIYNGGNIEYLREICKCAEEINRERAKLNIFLCANDGVMTEDLSKIAERYQFVKWIPRVGGAVQYCILFSALEKCIYRVNKPLEALIISPVRTAKTYSDQNFKEAFFLSEKEMGNLELSDDDDKDKEEWRDNLCACFSHDDGKIKMKQIRPEAFEGLGLEKGSGTECIDFILLIELFAGSNEGRNRVARTVVYQFKFDRPSSLRSIGHTFANKVNDKNPGAEDPIFTPICQLYDHRQGRSPNKVHGGDCEAYGGCHSFFYNDRLGGEAVSHAFDKAYYTKFVDDVYLYLGINIGNEERDYAIVKISNAALGNQYIFCKFKSGATINGAKYCKALSTCVEDVNPADVKSETESAQQISVAIVEQTSEHPIPAENATDDVRGLLQKLIDKIEPHTDEMAEDVDKGSRTYESSNAQRALSLHVHNQLTDVKIWCKFQKDCQESFIEEIRAAVDEIKKSWEGGLERIRAKKEEKEWKERILEQLVEEKYNVEQKIKELENILSGK